MNDLNAKVLAAVLDTPFPIEGYAPEDVKDVVDRVLADRALLPKVTDRNWNVFLSDLEQNPPLTRKEIGKRFGISGSRVRQIVGCGVLSKVRMAVREQLLNAPLRQGS